MASPLKVPSLVLKKVLSPKSPRYLSPRYEDNDNKKYLKCCYETKNTNLYENSNCKIKIDETTDSIPTQNNQSLLINSPNKLNLFKFGLSKYSLLHTIGKGSFGTVIRGNYKGNLIAVKLIKVEKPTDKINENNALNLFHENVIKIFDILRKSNEKFALVLMEYFENSKNLQLILDDTNFLLNKQTLIKFSKDIVNGVQYCHENGILHLDIKPKNVLLCNNVCKICDFGNSVKEVDAAPIYNYRGTVAYTAPEILKGEKPSTKSDIFSLGVLFWQFVTRKLPYQSLNNEVVIYKVVKFNLRPEISELGDEDFSKLCSSCWKKEPTCRPEANEIYRILNTFFY